MGVFNLFFLKSRTRKIINEFKLDNKKFYSWGMKRSGKYLRNNNQQKVVFIEDGFVHSFGMKKKNLPLSICYDKNGIYYDCNSRNDLKEFLKEKLSKENIQEISNFLRPDFDRVPSLGKQVKEFQDRLFSLTEVTM